MSISKKTEQVILGSLLGDSHIQSNKQHDKARIQYRHCEKQKEYIVYKNKLLSDSFDVSPVKPILVNKKYNNYWFQTRYERELSYYRNLFYNDCKVIKTAMLNKIKPLALAIWYMDDGNLILHKKDDGKVKK